MTGIVAGRVEVPVSSDTSGFAKELKKKIEAAAADIEARIGVTPDGDGLRSKLKNLVREAAAGLAADVDVDLDADALRTRMQSVVREASAGVRAEIEVDLDAHLLRERLQTVVAAAAAGVRAHVGVDVDESGAAVATPVTARDEFTPWWHRWVRRKQTEADGKPIEQAVVPSQSTKALDGVLRKLKTFDRFSSMFARTALMVIGVASLVEPALSLIVGGLGAGVGMLANLSTAAATLAVAPGGLAALIAVIGTGIIAFRGFTGELDAMPPKMRQAAEAVRGFKADWSALVTNVQERFWDGLAQPIQDTAKVFLPALSDGLGVVAESMSRVTEDLLRFFGSDDFIKDFRTVMRQAGGDLRGNLGVIDKAGTAVRNVLSAGMDLMVAAGPLMDRAADALVGWSQRLAEKWDTDAEKKRLATFLDYAGDKAAQAGRIIGDVTSGIVGIFRAGRDTNDGLLATLEEQTQRFANWANGSGAASIRQWFEDVAPVAEAAGAVIVDLVKAVAGLADDPSTANLLDQIRTELVPALTEFFDTLGTELGPEVITLLTELATLLANMGEAGGPLGEMVGVLNTVFGALNGFLAAHPGAGAAIGTIVGSLLAFSAVKPLLSKTGVLTLLGGALSAIAGGIDGLRGKKITVPNINGAAGKKDGATAAKAGTAAKVSATAGAKGPGVLTRMFSQAVYWTTAMPVYVTNAGALGGGSGTDVYADAPDGKDGKSGRGQTAKTTGTRGRVRGKFGAAFKGIGSALSGAGGWIASQFSRARSWTSGRVGQSIAANGKDGGVLRLPGAQRLAPAAAAAGGTAGAAGALRAATAKTGLLGGLFGKATSSSLGTKIASGARSLLKGGGLVGMIAGVAGDLTGQAIQDGNGGLRDLGGSALSGAAQGAGWGAMIGSVVPGVGTAIGAGVGAVAGAGISIAQAGIDWNKVSDEVGVAWNNVKTWTSDTWGSVSTAVSSAWTSATAAVSTGARAIGTEIGLFTTDAEGRITGMNLAGPAEYAATALANALPAPLQQAGVNIGLFETDAEGRITGIDLASPARLVATRMANALPAPLRQAGVNIGLFKTDAEGRITGVDLATPVKNVANRMANALPGPVRQALTNLGVFKRDAAGQVSIDLSGAGAKIVGSLAAGIRGAVGLARGAMSWVVDQVKRFVPNSPVPEGPLRVFNDGGPGRKLVEMFAGGIRKGAPAALAAMGDVGDDLAGAQFSLGSLRASGAAARSVGDLFDLGDIDGGGGITFMPGAIEVNNPAPEPASKSISDQLRNVSALVGTNGG